jgi:hypothetical protein
MAQIQGSSGDYVSQLLEGGKNKPRFLEWEERVAPCAPRHRSERVA